MTSLFYYEAIGFLLGLVFGSFLNVCISRIPKGESIVQPRSRCPGCKTPIRWYDNIPLLSWLLLRGRCRDCKQSIPWRYPLVELATGVWFAVVTHLTLSAFDVPLSTEQHAQLILAGVSLAILGFLLIGLMVIDWQTLTLPDAFTLTGIAIALFLVCTQAASSSAQPKTRFSSPNTASASPAPANVIDRGNVFLTGPENLIFGRIAAICGAALILLIIRWLYKALRHREGMGLGDVKLLAMIAAFLGFWPAILALFIGVLTASLYGIFPVGSTQSRSRIKTRLRQLSSHRRTHLRALR